ncbi:MAG: DUF349 domain-containing protein [Bacteroidaceae bacterium]|nr:DUF349 domain-containing protein [Prevotellaceae bacterium]MDY5632447.1 DUF349 domain-containing protein [Bacteroidaceae bacterium]
MDTLDQTPQAEAPVAEPAAVAVETPLQEAEDTNIPLMKTKEEVVARAQELAAAEEVADKQELDLLKQLYYRYHHADAMALRQEFIDNGGDAQQYVPAIDPTEEAFKEALQTIRQRRTDALLAQEKERQDNLLKKQAVIEKIKALATTPDEANNNYDAFRQLQSEWKEIGAVPAEAVTDVWKSYQLYVEQFYDMLKQNHEMRVYDFQKNLEAKTILCEKAEQLQEEADVVKALNKLQTLHQDWKEIGPVSKDLRESLWTRFKDASTIVRKRHQDYFENRKAQEEENLQKKTALCEQVEAIQTDGLSTFAQWDETTKQILELQAQWKTIGFAPQKQNNQIFERFRAACDKFFTLKHEYFQNVKGSLQENLEKKTALAEQAEALKDSTEWRKTTDALVELQKQWKEIGAVPRKVSDQLWKRFTSACDAFFEAKKAAQGPQRAEQNENLEKKQGIIQQLKDLLEQTEENAAQEVRRLQQQWNEVGHVPMREKDRVYAQYHEVVDALYKKFNLSQAQRRLSSFKNALKVTAEKEGSNLVRERDRLQRAFEMMKNEIQTYENNLGFLSVGSKKGNSLVLEIQRKVDKLKGELNLLAEKIKAVNQEIRKEQK